MGLAGTVVPGGVVLFLSLLVVALAGRPVERIAQRVKSDAWRAGLVGILAEIAVVPATVAVVVALVVSIVGIPLLVAGYVVEFVAWAVGFGAALMVLKSGWTQSIQPPATTVSPS